MTRARSSVWLERFVDIEKVSRSSRLAPTATRKGESSALIYGLENSL